MNNFEIMIIEQLFMSLYSDDKITKKEYKRLIAELEGFKGVQL